MNIATTDRAAITHTIIMIRIIPLFTAQPSESGSVSGILSGITA
jgi:hypothetical protein